MLAGVVGEKAGAAATELLLCAKPAGAPDPGVGLFCACCEGVMGLPDGFTLEAS